MKILVLHSYLNFKGGGERFILNFLDAATPTHDVEVWAWKVDLNKTFDGFKKYLKQIKEIGNADLPPAKIIKFSNLDLSRFDAVLACGFPSYFSALKNDNVVWKVMTLPGYLKGKNPMKLLLWYMEKEAVSKCKMVIVDSEFMGEQVRDNYYRDWCVIPHGIKLSDYKPGKNLGYFLHVSRLVPEKGLEELIEAWDTALPLKIVGTGEPEYVWRLRLIGENKRIEFPGEVTQKQLQWLYSNCTAVLLASENEPFGLTLIEGMASGKPVIALNSGGPADIVKPPFGFLCPNREKMVEKAEWLITRPKEAKEMGNAALKESKKYAVEDYYDKVLMCLKCPKG